MTREKCVFCKIESNCEKPYGPGDIWNIDCPDCGRYEMDYDAVIEYEEYIFDSHKIKKFRDWLARHPGARLTLKNIFVFL